MLTTSGIPGAGFASAIDVGAICGGMIAIGVACDGGATLLPPPPRREKLPRKQLKLAPTRKAPFSLMRAADARY
jgi:hypothetical protein